MTLDAQGDPTAVFIFQIGSTLTTASNAAVNMINSGDGCQVYWQIGTSATLGTGTAFVGNILALSSVTATTGASVAGRILARNGAVTLDNNAVGGCLVGQCPVIELQPTTLPQGTLGVAYSASVSASNGTPPYAYSVSAGALPTGLLLNAGTGEISGIPSALGIFEFTLTAIDAEGCERSRVYTVIIAAEMCPTLTLAPLTLPNGILGAPYSEMVTASGGAAPYTYSVTAGALPPGLVLDPATGGITGVLTTVGAFDFTITATDANFCIVSQPYNIVVTAPACPTLTLAPLTLPLGILGAPYSQVVSASGGTAPYTYGVTAGALPPGLILDPLSGEISGTLTAVGSFNFTITAVDANLCVVSQPYTIVVSPAACPPLSLTPATLAPMALGAPFSQILVASGGTAPYTYSVTGGALPPGLTLNPLSGLLAGTPTTIGPFAFQITATDALGCVVSLDYNGSVQLDAPAVAIPSLSAWSMLLLFGFVLGLGMVAMRR